MADPEPVLTAGIIAELVSNKYDKREFMVQVLVSDRASLVLSDGTHKTSNVMAVKQGSVPDDIVPYSILLVTNCFIGKRGAYNLQNCYYAFIEEASVVRQWTEIIGNPVMLTESQEASKIVTSRRRKRGSSTDKNGRNKQTKPNPANTNSGNQNCGNNANDNNTNGITNTPKTADVNANYKPASAQNDPMNTGGNPSSGVTAGTVSAQTSKSEQLRKEGNTIYERARPYDDKPDLKRKLLIKAIAKYESALEFAVDDGEKAMIEKNLGLAHHYIAALDLPLFEIIDNQRDSVRFLSSAITRGLRAGKEDQWLTTLRGMIERTLKTGIEHMTEWRRMAVDFDEARQWIRFYHAMIKYLQHEGLLSLAHYAFSQQLFHQAVKSREDGNFKDAIYFLEEMSFPLEETERLTARRSNDLSQLNGAKLLSEFKCDQGLDFDGIEVDLAAETRVKKSEASIEKSIAEAMQAIKQGEDLFSTAMMDEESPNMDAVFDALDWFKSASLKARENDLEQEAIACHHIGRIYEKVIKLKGRAKEYYMQTMTLSEACKPRTFYNRLWYTRTRDSLNEFQQEAVRRDDEAKQKERQKYLDQLKDEIKLLDENKELLGDLIDTVLANFPPKNEKKFKDADKKELKEIIERDDYAENGRKKKLLLKFLSDYHPDRNLADTYGKKWEVLSEEITKRVTNFYERLK